MFQTIKCPNCKTKVKAILQENRWTKWILVDCYSCGYRKIINNFDFIQPSSPFFKKIYKQDPFKNYEKEKKEKEIAKQKHKEKLEEEINKKFTKPWEKKFVEEKTLKEDWLK